MSRWIFSSSFTNKGPIEVGPCFSTFVSGGCCHVYQDHTYKRSSDHWNTEIKDTAALWSDEVLHNQLRY